MNYILFILFVLILNLNECSFKSNGNDFNNTSDSIRTVLCGLTIDTHTQKLLRNVELLFNEKVRDEVTTNMPPGLCGQSRIIEESIPWLGINNECSDQLTSIYHELCHLQLYGEGYPMIVYEENGQLIPPEGLLTWLQNNIFDPIVHLRFYDKMRKFGYKPDILQRSQLKDQINRKPDTLIFSNGPILYFKSFLEINDSLLLSDLSKWFLKYELGNELKVGSYLVNLVRNKKLVTFEDDIKVYVECLNHFFKDKYTFKINNVQKVDLTFITRSFFYIEIKRL